MKSFFDTSVLVATFLENHEHHERSFALFEDAHRKNACCGAHSLAEIYATLTRLPGKFRLGTDQVLLFIELIEERLEIVGHVAAVDGARTDRRSLPSARLKKRDNARASARERAADSPWS